MIVEKKEFRNKHYLFHSREEAGEQLAKLLTTEKFDLLFIIPNGGLPVGYGLLQALPYEVIPFDLLLVRKIQVPWSTEAGMGAVTPDGEVFLNKQVITQTSLNNIQIEKQIKQAIEKITILRSGLSVSKIDEIEGKSILLIDDGIASGFSMNAGAHWLKVKRAKNITIAVPTAPLRSLEFLTKIVDNIFCLNICEVPPFAVAEAYKNWFDLSFAEAKKIIQAIKKLYL